MRDSAEDSDDEREQPQNAVVSTSNENNNTSPPRESETSAQNLTPVIEYEDMHDQIELTNQDIQGIVFLRFERDEIKGETRRQVLQRWNPTVVLDDVNRNKNDKGHFEPK